jgi:hypothetical protein
MYSLDDPTEAKPLTWSWRAARCGMKTLFLIRHAKSSWDDAASPDIPKKSWGQALDWHCDKGTCNGRSTSHSNTREDCTGDCNR